MAASYFDGDLSAVNCIFFTCMALSDLDFFRRCSTCVNGGTSGIIMYFYMFLMLTNTDKVNRIISRAGNLPDELYLDTERYGTFLSPLISRYNNALDLVILELREKYKNR